MDLAQIRSFLAVIETGSFHGAAAKLGLTQPAVSQHVRKLEASMQAPLLLRNRNDCRPAPEAAEFVRLARGLAALAHRCKRSLGKSEVILGASSNIGIYMLPPIFHRLQAEVADAFTCRLLLDNNREIAHRLETREIDLALMEWWDHRPGFHAEPWKTEELVVLLPAQHPLARRGKISLEALAGYPLLGGEPATGTATLLSERYGAAVDSLRVSMNLGSTQAVKEGVRSGLGLSLIVAAAYRPDQDRDTLCIRPLEGETLSKTLFLIHPLDSTPAMMRVFHVLKIHAFQESEVRPHAA